MTFFLLWVKIKLINFTFHSVREKLAHQPLIKEGEYMFYHSVLAQSRKDQVKWHFCPLLIIVLLNSERFTKNWM